MGLSGPVAAVILVGALLGQAGNLYLANRNADQKVTEARETWQRRQEAMLEQAIRIDNATWNGTLQELTLNVTNTGTITLDAGRLDILVDGAEATSSITSSTIAGESTAVWNRGALLTLVLDQAGQPTDVVVVTEWGLGAAWRGV